MDRKSWIILLSATAALATAAVVTFLIRRARLDETLSSVPDLITDCYDKIKDIETDLSRIRTGAQPAAS